MGRISDGATGLSKVLVTGADGFIGSHLVQELLAAGHEVRAFCLYNSNGSWGWLDSLPEATKAELDVVLGDIRDPLCVREAMRGCEQVFHLAALIAIPYSYVAPASYVDTNIHGTLNVVQAARDLGVVGWFTPPPPRLRHCPVRTDHEEHPLWWVSHLMRQARSVPTRLLSATGAALKRRWWCFDRLTPMGRVRV